MLSLIMHERDLWEKILVRLEPTIQKSNFLTWFQDTALLEVGAKSITVGLPTLFARDWIANKYNVKILQAAKEVLPATKEIVYEVKMALKNADDPRIVDVKALLSGPQKKVRKLPGKEEMKVSEGLKSKYLNKRYTLDSYIVGKENRLAHAACQAVAHNPGGKYNPLFVFGGVGLGKTHLLQAIGNEILKLYPDNIVVYITSERFMNEIVEAIGKRNTKEFKDRYRNVGCLIIDDVQFFANKETTQMEFFHTFNELYDANKQIVISSDRPPKELDGLADRLKSRFEMGMTIEVCFPDYETRLAILQAKCQELEVIIPNDVLDFIAYNVHHSIRELEGVLKQAIGQAQLEQSTPTVKSVATLIRRLDREKPLSGLDEKALKKPIVKRPEEVMEIVADYFKITKSDLKGQERRKEILLPRQIGMYLIRQELGTSYESIGDDFGGRNHTTVLHACEKIMQRTRKDRKIVRDLNAIKQEMGL